MATDRDSGLNPEREYNCPKCGEVFTMGVKFCNKCGCNLELEFIETPTCPVCGKIFPIGTKFCSEHGATLVPPEQLIPRCSGCGKQYADGTKFCPDCGGKVSVTLKKQGSPANEVIQTMTEVTSSVSEVLRNKFSISAGVFAGTFGVIFFSLFNWIKIPIEWGFMHSIKATLFNIVGLLNNHELRYFLDGSTNFTFIRIISVILVIALFLSFVLLIASLLMKSQSKTKPTLAYCGFGLCAIVAAIFIVAMIYISIEIDRWILTVFPFFTLTVAILAMVFAVKRPAKEDLINSVKEIQKNMKSIHEQGK